MGGYFKPRRRRIGVVTLVMACAFMAAWLRSYDWASFPLDLLIHSDDGIIDLKGSVWLFGRNPDEYQFEFDFGIPYWSIVVPLTLVSTWLLLGKLREKPKASVESRPETAV